MSLRQSLNRFYYGMTLTELTRMHQTRSYCQISYNSLLYLDLVDMTPDCTVSKLAEILHVSKSAITMKVNELVKQGLVEKVQSDDDARVKFIRVKAEAVEQYRAYDAMAKQAIKTVEKTFSKKQIQAFCQVLDTFTASYTKDAVP
ncbi:MAG: MarR family winged helix-turn-helix transcriptional regulator [Planctomycetes bacterium]|nr:MarR family winged helix-turn-helix transcriptional regulator [Planctomycetota bacterium]